MNIGNKIRALRIQRGLTQKQLAGELITRNMLSQIENGTALPSIGSLLYIAERLDVSPAYFFDESERPQGESESMLCSLYNEGEYEKCISAGSALPSSESGNILAQCYLNIAVNDFMQMKYRAARESLLLAKEQCESAADITDTVYNIVMSLLRLPDVGADADYDELSTELLPSSRAMASDFYLYMLSNATSCKDTGELNRNAIYGLHIAARADMSADRYEDAILTLRAAEAHITPQTPPALSYMIYDDIELCFLRTDNYKEAYEISRKKHAILK